MCTVSFVPNGGGFFLAMNRDESLNREIGQPPQLRRMKQVLAVYPSEAGGRTWIAANDFGIALALLNTNDISVRDPKGPFTSRGTLIPQLIRSSHQDAIASQLFGMRLESLRPFRLVSISQIDPRIVEFSWNGVSLEIRVHHRRMHHWFSSSAGDAEAELRRSQIVSRALALPNAGTLPWIRALHASHDPSRSGFGICAHRADGGSVSYSEIVCGVSEIRFAYRASAPCERSNFESGFALSLARTIQCAA